MKAILKFDLDAADDAMAHRRCVKSLEMACFIFDLTNNTRKKFTDDENYCQETADKIFEEIYSGMVLNGIIIDELIE